MLTLVWGLHWPIVKAGLDYFPPLTYATLRIFTGLLTIVAILAPRRRLRRPSSADLPIILSVGLAQIAGSIIIQNIALQFVPAGRSSVLYYTMPLWVAVLLWLAFGARPRRNELLGVGLGVTGVLVLVNPTVIDWGAPAEVAGTLALAGYAVIWAAVTIHIRRHRWHASPLALHPWMLLIALVPVALAALALEPGRAVRWEPMAVVILAYSGPLATAFAFWASQAITRSLGPIAAATGFLLTPVIGLVSGALILHETLGAADLAGFALVVAGIAAATLVSARSADAG
jgi:drug/metabolite transporter (DMT)-like permease